MIWECRDDRIYVSEDDEDFGNFCEKIFVDKTEVDLLTGEEQVVVHLYARTGLKKITLNRSEVSKGIVRKLLGQGLTVLDNPDNDMILSQILLESAENGTLAYIHDRLGFVQMPDEKWVFLAHHPIGMKDSLKVKSTYIDSRLTAPCGSFAEWMRMVDENVLDHPNLELALALGAMAPVAWLLQKMNILQQVPIIALTGRSSTGKTTALRLAASMYGSPEEGTGLLSDFNCTPNAFFAQLDRGGFPAVFDEASAVADWNLTPILFNLPKGRGKRRCNGEGKLLKDITYGGAVLISGERTLMNQAHGVGIRARLLELTLPWTDDAYHAATVTKKCRENYGHAVVPLAEWLLTNHNQLPIVWTEWMDYFSSLINLNNGIEVRLANIYATILTSAEVLENALGISMQKEKFADILLEQHTNNRLAQATDEVVFEEFRGRILDNAGRFIVDVDQKGRFTGHHTAVWGMYTTLRNKSEKVLLLRQEIAQEWAAEIAGTNMESLQRAWSERGWLVKFSSNHYFARRDICGVDTKCYALRVEGNATPSQPKKVKKPKKVAIKSKAKELLSSDPNDELVEAVLLENEDDNTEVALVNAGDAAGKGEAENPN